MLFLWGVYVWGIREREVWNNCIKLFFVKLLVRLSYFFLSKFMGYKGGKK